MAIVSAASTTTMTASRNSQMSRRAFARALACWAKKFMAADQVEADLRHRALLGRFDLQQLRGLEAEHAGDDAVREDLALRCCSP